MNYLKYVLSLILVILLVGCSSKKEGSEEEVQPTTKELLQGDWVTGPYLYKDEEYLYNYSLSVQEDFFTFLSFHEDSVHFKIKSNTINLFSSKEDVWSLPASYKIILLEEDSLELLVYSEKIKNHFANYGWSGDTLRFRKLKKLNNLTPKSIEFASSTCFGTCPSFMLRINDDRSFIYYGEAFTDYDGPGSGVIEVSDYDLLLQKLQQIPLASIKREHIASYTDAQTKNLIIRTEDTIIKTVVYGSSDEPFELQVLFNMLVSMDHVLEINKDTTVNRYTSFDEFLDEDPFEEEEEVL